MNLIHCLYRFKKKILKKILKKTIIKSINDKSISKFDLRFTSLILGLNLRQIKLNDFKNITYVDKLILSYPHFTSTHSTINKKHKIILTSKQIHIVYLINDVVINPETPILIKNEVAYYLNYDYFNCFSQINLSGGNIICHGTNNCLIEKNQIINLDKGIFLGGNFPNNWYHWIIEILSKIISIKQESFYDKYPLLVPGIINDLPNHKKLLLNFTNNREIIYLNSKFSYRVTDLIYPEAPCIAPPSFKVVEYREHHLDYHTCETIMRCYKSELDELSIDSNLSFNKIFLARKLSRTNYNQDEIISFLENIGFKSVYTEDLTLDQQISIFRNANMIVGPTGAAWANLIFCKNKPRAIIWVPELLDDASTYSNLAIISNVNLLYVNFKTRARSWNDFIKHDEYYEISTELLSKAIFQFEGT